MRDKQGRKLYRHLTVKIELPGLPVKTRKFTPPPHQGFHEDGIDNILESIADDLDRVYPFLDYKLVPLGANSFRFVHVGYRVPSNPPVSQDPPTTEATGEQHGPETAVAGQEQ